MKTILIIIFAGLFSVQISEAQWVQIEGGIGNVDIWSFFANSNKIFAGSNHTIYVSTNGGTNWTGIYGEFENKWFSAIAANGSNIFAGTIWGPINTDGVYLSTNNGTNWALTSLNNRYVNALAISGNYIFAGTDDHGVYFSTDNGANWFQTGLNNRTILSLAITGTNVYAGSSGFGLYLSTNNGASWTQSALNNLTVLSIAVNGNNVFGGTEVNGVYFSSNGGSNWLHTSLDTAAYVTSLLISGNSVFAGSYYSGFSVSTDNGTTWIQRNEGFNHSTFVRALCISNNFIFASIVGYAIYRRPLSDIIGINTISTEIPEVFSLAQNFPNPFNPSTKINFQVSVTKYVELKVYDIPGNEVAELVSRQLKPGTYEVDWNAVEYPSGVYFYRLNAGEFSETKKMVLIK